MYAVDLIFQSLNPLIPAAKSWNSYNLISLLRKTTSKFNLWQGRSPAIPDGGIFDQTKGPGL